MTSSDSSFEAALLDAGLRARDVRKVPMIPDDDVPAGPATAGKPVKGALTAFHSASPEGYQRALLESGLELVRAGYFIFPLSVSIEAGKKIVLPGGRWQEMSSNSPDRVRFWFERAIGESARKYAGIGIDCGKSGIIAIDLDGRPGKSGWASIENKFGSVGLVMEPTARAITWSGGIHLLYRAWGDGEYDVRNTAGAIAAGIDTRGDGGFIIAAPTLAVMSRGSTTINYAGQYRWADDKLPAVSDLKQWPRILKVYSQMRAAGDRDAFWAALKTQAAKLGILPDGNRVVQVATAEPGVRGTILDPRWGGKLAAMLAEKGIGTGSSSSGTGLDSGLDSVGIVSLGTDCVPTGLEDYVPDELENLWTVRRAMAYLTPYYELAYGAAEGTRNVKLNNLAVMLSHFYDPIHFNQSTCAAAITQAAAGCGYLAGPRELADVQRWIEIACRRIPVTHGNRWVAVYAVTRASGD